MLCNMQTKNVQSNPERSVNCECFVSTFFSLTKHGKFISLKNGLI